MKTNIMFFALVAAFVAHAEIAASNVKIRQDWPWSNKVTLTYDLAGVSTDAPGEVVVKALSDGVEIPMQGAGLTGDIYNLTEAGSQTITIDPVRAFGKGLEMIQDFKVSVTARAATDASTNVVYKIFDLNERTVTDVTRGDLLNGKYGTVETDFGAIGEGYNTTLEDVIIWTGVTNDIAYKTTKLVLRKIPAGDFKGYAPGGTVPESNNMTWTFDYWIGVFEMTQKQRSIIRAGSWETRSDIIGDTLPDQYVQNWYLYGAGQNRDATTNSAQTAGLLINLRERFKVDGVCPYDFELPSQVQWGRAMRAGADSYYYDGLPDPFYASISTNDAYSVLANCVFNGGLVQNADGSVTTNIMEVGRFRPNAYGLYDMLGNVREHIRESGDASTHGQLWNTTAGTNVVGKTSESNHSITFGGAITETGASGSKGFGAYTIQTHSSHGGSRIAGFRVCMQSMEDGITLYSLFNK